jgi:hypothetical protein
MRCSEVVEVAAGVAVGQGEWAALRLLALAATASAPTAGIK